MNSCKNHSKLHTSEIQWYSVNTVVQLPFQKGGTGRQQGRVGPEQDWNTAGKTLNPAAPLLASQVGCDSQGPWLALPDGCSFPQQTFHIAGISDPVMHCLPPRLSFFCLGASLHDPVPLAFCMPAKPVLHWQYCGHTWIMAAVASECLAGWTQGNESLGAFGHPSYHSEPCSTPESSTQHVDTLVLL
jgi:hypothetical protein